MKSDAAALEAVLGYEFRSREPLVRALTHRSRAYEQAPAGDDQNHNEQLEFLGDAILGFVVSDALVRRFPTYREGQLTKLRAQLVSAAHLHTVAQRIGLGEFLLLGRGEEMTGGRSKRALLSDAVEAIIAAVYLDGGIEAARAVVERCVVGDLAALDCAVPGFNDYKSALQQLAQSRGFPAPRYSVVASEGPEHAKSFTIEARVGTQYVSHAEGPSKKAASQRAARILFEQLDLGKPAGDASRVLSGA